MITKQCRTFDARSSINAVSLFSDCQQNWRQTTIELRVRCNEKLSNKLNLITIPLNSNEPVYSVFASIFVSDSCPVDVINIPLINLLKMLQRENHFIFIHHFLYIGYSVENVPLKWQIYSTDQRLFPMTFSMHCTWTIGLTLEKINYIAFFMNSFWHLIYNRVDGIPLKRLLHVYTEIGDSCIGSNVMKKRCENSRRN